MRLRRVYRPIHAAVPRHYSPKRASREYVLLPTGWE